MSRYTNPPDTTPITLRKRSSRINHANISPIEAHDFDDNLEVFQFEPFVEVCHTDYIFLVIV